MATSIETAKSGDALWIRLMDSATMKTAPLLLDCVADPAHGTVSDVKIDLSRCRMVDSTFAGCLVGLLKNSRGEGGPQIHLVHLSEGCRRSLSQMNLDQLFHIEKAPCPDGLCWRRYLGTDHSEHQKAEVVIQAHEQLAEASPRNQHFGRIANAFRNDQHKRPE